MQGTYSLWERAIGEPDVSVQTSRNLTSTTDHEGRSSATMDISALQDFTVDRMVRLLPSLPGTRSD